MSDDEVMDSIDRHFMVGCGFIDAVQFRSHEASGICPECKARAMLAARDTAVPVAAGGGDTTGHHDG